MFRFFKYVSYVVILDSISTKIKMKFRSAALAVSGACLIGIGALYILFHTAMEFDQYGQVTFNAQKTVCIAFMLSGLALILISRKPARIPESRNLFRMMNKETAKFLEQTSKEPIRGGVNAN